MKKMVMLLDMFEALETNNYFVVAIKAQNLEKPEIILNPPSNVHNKMKYYSDAYNECLELKTNKNIEIIAYAKGSSDMEALTNITHKLEGVVC